MVWQGEPATGNANVMVATFAAPSGPGGAYVLWAPTSNGTTVPGYALDVGGATTVTQVSLADQKLTGVETTLSPSGGKVSVDVSESPVLVLVDALYFKGTWQNGFSTALTQPRSFTLSDGTQVQVPTMTGMVSLGIGTVKTASLAVYELPYMGGALAMDFLVPQTSLASLETALTPALLAEATGSLAPSQPAQLYLPKFSFGTRLVLNDVLAGMGMPDAFDSATANFSGMDGDTDIFVQTVVHQAFVEVDEEGTVAAAATGESNGGALFSPPTIAIASPFLFLIRDTHNGSLLFMGRVEDPRGS